MRQFPLIILLCLLSNAMSAQQNRRPEPYAPEEFPLFLHKTRRFEIIFFGTIPITMLASSLGLTMMENAANKSGALDPVPMTPESIGSRVAIALSLSGVLAVVDFIIEEERLSRQQKKRTELLRQLEENAK